MKRRFTALFVAIIVTLAIFPVTALASTHLVSNAAELDTALAAAQDGDVIQLGASFTYYSCVTIMGKTITFDVGAYTLDISPVSGDAITVSGGGQLNLTAVEGGELNASGNESSVHVVNVYNNGDATVTNVSAVGINSIGIFAETNASVHVTGGVTADGSHSKGIWAWNSTVMSDGNVSAQGDGCTGVTVGTDSVVTVSGRIDVNGEEAIGVYALDGSFTADSDIQAEGSFSTGVLLSGSTATITGSVQADDTGLSVLNGSDTTIDGTLSGESLMMLQGVAKTHTDFLPDTTKTGYATFSDGSNTVWVNALTVTFKTDGSDYAIRTPLPGAAVGSTNWPVEPVKDGLAFGGWYTEENGTGDEYKSDTVFTSDTTLHARWGHAVTATAGKGGSISPQDTIVVRDGDSLSFSVSANDHYGIASVLVDGVDQGAVSAYTFDNVTENHSISASFVVTSGFTVSALSNNPAFGSVSGEGVYAPQEEVVLTATPKTGYCFVRWTENGMAVSTQASYTFTAEVDRNLVAEFETALGAPAVNPVSTSFTAIKVSWSAVPGADGYEVWYGTQKFGTYSLKYTSGSGAAGSWTKSGLTTDKAYYFKMRAFKTVNGVKVYGPDSAIQTAPGRTSIIVARASSTSAKVTWITVSGSSGYEVWRGTQKNGTYALKYTAKSSATNWTNSGLTTGKAYYYKVRSWRVVSGQKVCGQFSAINSVVP